MGAPDAGPCEKLDYARSLRPRPPSRISGAIRAWRLHGWRYALRKSAEVLHIRAATPSAAIARPRESREWRDGLLGLQPGDVVEVRSAEEILATLDRKHKHQGLGFQPEMYRYCGQRMVVVNRVERIFVEASGNLRTGIRGTVLLEGGICDGSSHGGCDARCHHLWREVWLRRFEEPLEEADG